MIYYSPEILHHFEYPANVGTIPHASVDIMVGSPHEGGVIKLGLVIEDDIIKEIKYKAYGAIAIACMSYMSEKVIGKNTSDAMKTQAMDIAHDLNIDSLHLYNCLLAVDALQGAIMKYRKGNTFKKRV